MCYGVTKTKLNYFRYTKCFFLPKEKYATKILTASNFENNCATINDVFKCLTTKFCARIML